jgi:hypothetical protein
VRFPSSEGDNVERNDAIAWALATFVWFGALALFIWLAARERSQSASREPASLRVWIGSRAAAGVAIWAVAFGGARWLERRLEQRPVHQRQIPTAATVAPRAEARPTRSTLRTAEASRGPSSARRAEGR